MDFQIEVNNRMIDAVEGETILTVLRRNGIRVPTLCHMNRFSPTGACRLCVVEVEGKRDLITSCSYPVEKGMKVLTNSKRVIKARKSLVELLLSNHPDDCLYCQRNGNCELQWLAEEMNVRERKYFGEKNKYFPDYSGISVGRDPAKCVLCSRCVRMCEEVQLVTAIDFIGRSNKTLVNSAFQKGLNESSCIDCGQCITVCPTSALTDISHIEKVQAAIDNRQKKVMFFVSPPAMASFAEEFNIKPNADLGGMIAAVLRKCGVSMVYHQGFAGDLNVMNEARQLMHLLESPASLPLMSSCCPSWTKYVASFRPEWAQALASARSPQQIMGSLIKFGHQEDTSSGNDSIFTVSVTACTANKYEASREEMTHKGISEVDAVLTVREFLRFIRTHGIDLKNIEPEAMNEPFDKSSAAAWKMAYSGGKAEAVAMEVYRLLGGTPGAFRFNVPKNVTARKESRVSAGDKNLGFAWVSGIAEADAYIEMLIAEGRTDIHYIEVMACPGGCAGGGGQPINRMPEKPKNRKRICQEMEKFAMASTPSDHTGLAGY